MIQRKQLKNGKPGRNGNASSTREASDTTWVQSLDINLQTNVLTTPRDLYRHGKKPTAGTNTPAHAPPTSVIFTRLLPASVRCILARELSREEDRIYTPQPVDYELEPCLRSLVAVVFIFSLMNACLDQTSLPGTPLSCEWHHG